MFLILLIVLISTPFGSSKSVVQQKDLLMIKYIQKGDGDEATKRQTQEYESKNHGLVNSKERAFRPYGLDSLGQGNLL